MHLEPAPALQSACVPDGSLVYAVGDVHGRADLLRDLLERIRAHAEGIRASRRVLVFLGDYVDRGADSPGVLELLLAGPPPGFAQVCLMGNHEAALLALLDGGPAGPWLAMGGADTARAYLGEEAAGLAEDDLRARLRAALPAAHLAFLRGLGMSHAEGGYFFVHAGVRPGVPLDRQEPRDLLWIRRDFLMSGHHHGKTVVHGHSAVDQPQVRPNRIGIDTSAWSSNRLTALALHGACRGFLQTA